MNLRIGRGAAMAALLIAAAAIPAAVEAAYSPYLTPRKRRDRPQTPSNTDMTAEQRAWNEAVDRRKAEKKARRGLPP